MQPATFVSSAEVLSRPYVLRCCGLLRRDCVCAGLDLSRLHGSYVAEGIDNNGAHENGWQYRVDVCDEIPFLDKPAGCPDTASHVLQYPTPEGQRLPDMPKTTGCSVVGSEIKTAQLVMRGGVVGVDLTFHGSVPSNASDSKGVSSQAILHLVVTSRGSSLTDRLLVITGPPRDQRHRPPYLRQSLWTGTYTSNPAVLVISGSILRDCL